MSVGAGGVFSTLPANASVSELLSKILTYVGQPDDPDARTVAEDAVKSAIGKMNSVPWQWMRQYDDIVPVVDNYVYSLRRDVIQPDDRVELQDSDGNPNGTLQWVNPDKFVRDYDYAVTSGWPTHFTMQGYVSNGTLSLNYMPNSGFVSKHPNMRLWFLASIQFPISDSAKLNIPDNAEAYVEQYAKAMAASVLAPKRAALAAGIASDLWAQMMRNNSRNVVR